MFLLRVIPLFAIVLIAYNLVVFSTEGAGLQTVLVTIPLVSEGSFDFDISSLLITLGIVFLYIEIIKATGTSVASIIEHVLSLLVFIAFLVEFIVVKQASTPTFFILTLMSLLDVIAGFTISISSARRDVSMG